MAQSYDKLRSITAKQVSELVRFSRHLDVFQSTLSNPSFSDCKSLEKYMPASEFREMREALLTIEGI